MTSVAPKTWARDADIREVLRSKLRSDHSGEDDVLLVEEMGLCQGDARIDLGVINGYFIGYEIKSPRDTLERLPHQVSIYSRTLDEVTVVTCLEHVEGVLELVPEWWGVKLVEGGEAGVTFNLMRAPARNPNPDPTALVQLLWRDEALSVLEERGLDRGVRSKPKQAMWDRLVECLEWEELHFAVRHRLKTREGWTTAQRLA